MIGALGVSPHVDSDEVNDARTTSRGESGQKNGEEKKEKQKMRNNKKKLFTSSPHLPAALCLFDPGSRCVRRIITFFFKYIKT